MQFTHEVFNHVVIDAMSTSAECFQNAWHDVQFEEDGNWDDLGAPGVMEFIGRHHPQEAVRVAALEVAGSRQTPVDTASPAPAVTARVDELPAPGRDDWGGGAAGAEPSEQ